MPESSLAKGFAIVPGSRISHYRIESKIGEGGMGEVFLATDLTLERQVALKILPPQLLGDADRVRRFVQEAKSASALNHPNIVTIYEIGQAQVLAGNDSTEVVSDGPAPESSAHTVHYMAMEFIEGKTLRAMIYGGAPLSDVLKMLAQSADGLAKAHDAGIVHRDLKPDNIMVTNDGYAKIVDFGLAKLTEQKQQQKGGGQLTQSGVVMGTVGYMSPEQVEGGVITPASDIFSFGCIIFECATKKRPFESDLAIDTLHKIMFSEPLPLVAVTASAPSALQPVIDRCLRKKPTERYGSMREVAVALREVAPLSGPMAQPAPLAAPSPYSIPGPESTGSRRVSRPAAAPELSPVRRSSRRRTAARIFSNFYRLAFLAIVIGTIYIWVTMPPVAKLGDERPATVADWVDFGDVAPAARRAVVAATDPMYYKRRVLHMKDIDKLFAAGSQGERSLYLPSPLTRAVAKALYPLSKWNPIAPVRYFVVAGVMERTLSRRRVVELYLNAVRFGEASGVADAAKRYYKKEPSRLTDKEAAMIAALASATAFDPANPDSDLVALQANILGSLPPEPKKPPRKKTKTSDETPQPKSESDDAAAFGVAPEATETTTDPAPAERPKSER